MKNNKNPKLSEQEIYFLLLEQLIKQNQKLNLFLSNNNQIIENIQNQTKSIIETHEIWLQIQKELIKKTIA
jgi:hypothetical protein